MKDEIIELLECIGTVGAFLMMEVSFILAIAG